MFRIYTVIKYFLLFFLLMIPVMAFAAGSDNFSEMAPKIKGSKKVGKIEVIVSQIFEDEKLPWAFDRVNDLKASTRKYVVKQELPFKEGDSIDSFTLEETLRRLRLVRYLRNPTLKVTERDDEVDIVVYVQDTWTITPEISASQGTGNDSRRFGLGESNLLGYGKRLEFLYEEDDTRDSYGAVWDDRNFLGGQHELQAAWFDRDDGHTWLTKFSKPFKTLLDKQAWEASAASSDTIGRLFEAGDEDFIYRQENGRARIWYGGSLGDPEKRLRRYRLGYTYQEDDFKEAEAEDYERLGLDPDDMLPNEDYLAEDRRYSGPEIGLEAIEADYFSHTNLDRFGRVQDVNLGERVSFTAHVAPEFLGSRDDALIMSGNYGTGAVTGRNSFIRGELGFSSRVNNGVENNLFRAEFKSYRIFKQVEVAELFLGQHTIASGLFIDYGEDLDLDRQLTLGADNYLRGYEARTFTGDKRIALNIEDRVTLAENVYKLVDLGLAVFADAGGATYESFGDLVSDRIYADVGVGLRIGFPRSSGGSVLRLDFALALREAADGTEVWEPRVSVRGGQVFGTSLRSEKLGSQRASAGIGFDR